MDFTQCSKQQIQGLVRERNQYRQLLKECLYALNTIPNKRIVGLETGTTYELAAAIGSALKQSANS
ncbi:MAG TPA: hypothetical protein ENJ28_01300 [Gammaproteobacteria bacterium]|nr:hypothetical protein [Gammaproteobacteria bacterium]